MSDAYHDALVAERARLIAWLRDATKGELPSGVPVTTTPETIRHVEAEVARLTELIAKDRPDA